MFKQCSVFNDKNVRCRFPNVFLTVSAKVQTTLGNQTTPKHVIQCKKYGDTPKNVFSRAWQEKL